MMHLLSVALESITFTIKDIVLVCFFVLLYLFFIYCVMAFFSGWDGAESKRSKIYRLFYNLGYKLYLAHKVKDMIKGQGNHDDKKSDSDHISS